VQLVSRLKCHIKLLIKCVLCLSILNNICTQSIYLFTILKYGRTTLSDWLLVYLEKKTGYVCHELNLLAP
jgi:hypothetical protein